MTLIDQAKDALLDLADLTEGIAHGAPPDVHSVLGYQSKMIRFYTLIGEEMAKKFGNKERSYLARKIEQAKQHERGRIDLKLTSKDSEQRAMREVRQLHEEEIERAQEFEMYRVFLRSLQNGFEHTRSIASFLKRQEENPFDQ
jgi:hypothetical protein